MYLRSDLRSYCIHKLYIHIVLSWKMAVASALRHQLRTDLRACSAGVVVVTQLARGWHGSGGDGGGE